MAHENRSADPAQGLRRRIGGASGYRTGVLRRLKPMEEAGIPVA
jgi:hypothetical protein